MLTLSLIFFLLYFSAHFYYIQVGRFKANQLLKNNGHSEKICLDELSVIIPFRNEKERIEPLLNSIRNSSHLPKQIIFVDDHSVDDSTAFIQETLHDLNITMLHLDENSFGKKSAIQVGINNSQTSMILTLDADTWFSHNYFKNLTMVEKSDLIILPIQFNCPNFYSTLLHLDVILLNELNYGLSGVSKPIVASGANLMFSKESYKKYNSLHEHISQLSGDDMFLLQNFKKNNCHIQVIPPSELFVHTDAVKTFKELINQRYRWLKKIKTLKDNKAKFWGLFEIFNQFFLSGLVIYGLFSYNYRFCFIIFGLKIILDCFFYIISLFKLFRNWSIPLLICYQIFFPIYTLIIGFSMLFTRVSWKGRPI